MTAVEKQSLQVYLSQGLAYINARNQKNILQFDVPISSVRAHGLAVFEVFVAAEGSTDISVLEGTVYV